MSLAERQRALLAALLGVAEPPAAFDGDRLDVQRDALLAKRRGLVLRAHPELRGVPGVARLFAQYALEYPGRPPGGTAEDAHRFLDWLADR